ncbi:hypothetical protein KC330_g18 [Hortaea werneckii]|nr:hypothetical protein KC330_g18 [Hortaea werneckii]
MHGCRTWCRRAHSAALTARPILAFHIFVLLLAFGLSALSCCKSSISFSSLSISALQSSRLLSFLSSKILPASSSYPFLRSKTFCASSNCALSSTVLSLTACAVSRIFAFSAAYLSRSR